MFPQIGDEVINSVSHCLVTLKCPCNKKKKQHKVAFTELSPSEPHDNNSSESGKCNPLSEPLTGSVSVEELYNGYLMELVCNICSLCLDKISENNSLLHLKLLSCLVPHFTSAKLMKTLLNKTSQRAELDNNNYSVLSEQFVNHTLFPWIKLSFEHCLPCGETGHVSGVFTNSRSVDYLIAIFCGIITTLSLVKQVELVSESLQVRCLHLLVNIKDINLRCTPVREG